MSVATPLLWVCVVLLLGPMVAMKVVKSVAVPLDIVESPVSKPQTVMVEVSVVFVVRSGVSVDGVDCAEARRRAESANAAIVRPAISPAHL